MSPEDLSGAMHEQELPGIGKRYDQTTEDGRISVVIHHSGRRDLYVTEKAGRSQVPTVVTLTDDQARRLGAVLAGAYFQPTVAQRIEAVVGGLVIDWVTMRDRLARRRAQHRRPRGAAEHPHDHRRHPAGRRDVIVVPEPTEVLHARDKLVVIGRPEDLPGFIRHVART